MTETREPDVHDHAHLLRTAAARIVARVAKRTAILTAAAVVAVLSLRALRGGSGEWWEAPAGVLFGAGLGLLNFRWIAASAERMYAKQGMTPGRGLVIWLLVTALKLSTIFVVLFTVIFWQLLDIIAVVGGLSVCFLAIVGEGFLAFVRGTRGEENQPKA